MAFPFSAQPALFASHEEAALYYSSPFITYDYRPEQSYAPSFFPSTLPIHYSFCMNYPAPLKLSDEENRPTGYFEPTNTPVLGSEIKVELRSDVSLGEERGEEKGKRGKERVVRKREKSLKKNTESNLINNVFSFLSSELKSHRQAKTLVNGNDEKLKIFYIFVNNLKKLNGKYLNHRNVKALCDLLPQQPQTRMLAKSVKRLQILPICQLRSILRRLIYSYLRGPTSLLPLLTSNKICRVAMVEHLKKRRQLIHFVETELEDTDKLNP